MAPDNLADALEEVGAHPKLTRHPSPDGLAEVQEGVEAYLTLTRHHLALQLNAAFAILQAKQPRQHTAETAVAAADAVQGVVEAHLSPAV